MGLDTRAKNINFFKVLDPPSSVCRHVSGIYYIATISPHFSKIPKILNILSGLIHLNKTTCRIWCVRFFARPLHKRGFGRTGDRAGDIYICIYKQCSVWQCFDLTPQAQQMPSPKNVPRPDRYFRIPGVSGPEVLSLSRSLRFGGGGAFRRTNRCLRHAASPAPHPGAAAPTLELRPPILAMPPHPGAAAPNPGYAP